ncbi:RNA-binding protein 1 [Artemisia annua]|uniref:RNA-binding protein 1 n=1 Tax=Artemisia annua TaxID=35608 RepID=A0A2U1KVV5_ARTAN|nr:RNA-binding protein 1 [Artemisia annua]
MQKNFHELCGKLVEVKRVVPKEISTGGTTSGMRIPWGPLPMPVYPAYLNGGHGLMGMAANGCNGIVAPYQMGYRVRVVVDNNSLVSSGVTMDGSRNDVQNGVEG